MTEVFIFVLIIAFAYWTRRTILERMESGGPALSEIEWNEHNTLVYPLYANVAGLVAGMFGVGGGIIKGPLMLALGTCLCRTLDHRKILRPMLIPNII